MELVRFIFKCESIGIRVEIENVYVLANVFSLLVKKRKKIKLLPSLLQSIIHKMSKILPAGIDFGNLKTLMEIFQINENDPDKSQLVYVVDRNGNKVPP